MRRRLAAILAADIVGYSKLFSDDEAGTLAAIEALRTGIILPQLARHSGRIFRFIGDSTLIEFESALGAVQFAVQVQQSLAAGRNMSANGLTLRMGIDLGDVLADEEEIHGDAINIAVRLEEIAEPGGICLSENSRPDPQPDRYRIPADRSADLQEHCRAGAGLAMAGRPAAIAADA